jgi:hypothetical protein
MLDIVYDHVADGATFTYDVGPDPNRHLCYRDLRDQWVPVASHVDENGRLRLPTSVRSDPEDLSHIYRSALAQIDRAPDRTLIVATRHTDSLGRLDYELGLLLLPTLSEGTESTTQRPPEWLDPEGSSGAGDPVQTILVETHEVHAGDQYPYANGVVHTVRRVVQHGDAVTLWFEDGGSTVLDWLDRVEIIRGNGAPIAKAVAKAVANPTPIGVRAFRPIDRQVRAVDVEIPGMYLVDGIGPQYLSKGIYVIDDDGTLRPLTHDQEKDFRSHYEAVPVVSTGSTPCWKRLRLDIPRLPPISGPGV